MHVNNLYLHVKVGHQKTLIMEIFKEAHVIASNVTLSESCLYSFPRDSFNSRPLIDWPEPLDHPQDRCKEDRGVGAGVCVRGKNRPRRVCFLK